MIGVHDVPALVMVLVIAGIVVTAGLITMDSFQQTIYNNSANATQSAAYNATGQTITGLSQFSNNFSTLAIIIVMAVIIGVVITSFAGRMQTQ